MKTINDATKIHDGILGRRHCYAWNSVLFIDFQRTFPLQNVSEHSLASWAILRYEPYSASSGGGGGGVGGRKCPCWLWTLITFLLLKQTLPNLATFPKIYLATIWFDRSWSKQFDVSTATVFWQACFSKFYFLAFLIRIFPFFSNFRIFVSF